ncbi:SDR family NAD(P)-dependent oxidoreductase [Flavobacteriales bacterium]|nr:SDR family NAD(P)-dependent oxidoreductase [Flavobacteriales bacterium]
MNIIITGGHSGIGYELTKKVLSAGHKVGLVVRNEIRKKEAMHLFGQDSQIDFFTADLSRREEVKQLARDIKSSWGVLDGLFNNAGALTAEEQTSPQGVELQFEVNSIAPYTLATQLAELLSLAEKPFIISTVTERLHKEKVLDIEDLKRPKKFVKLMGSYLRSKLALALLMKNFAKEQPKIKVLSVNPGGNKTKMTSSNAVPLLFRPLVKLLFSHPSKGAQRLFDAAFSKPHFESGAFVTNGSQKELKITLSEGEVVELLRL